ncbi:CPXCG motif-containing cysteine-rich protein [Gallaecimonas sp. GXIMD4217]|uniref:CPXCG motif-containing cysteine-rich protein n=1 Tax=Gallaecimonas sp. GXIMD4217 TaxID=3131927 RepID=UPI00311B23EC
MDDIKRFRVECPNCGSHVFITVEPDDVGQDFVEECAACCCSMHIQVTEELDGEVVLQLDGEDEQIY